MLKELVEKTITTGMLRTIFNQVHELPMEVRVFLQGTITKSVEVTERNAQDVQNYFNEVFGELNELKRRYSNNQELQGALEMTEKVFGQIRADVLSQCVSRVTKDREIKSEPDDILPTFFGKNSTQKATINSVKQESSNLHENQFAEDQTNSTRQNR